MPALFESCKHPLTLNHPWWKPNRKLRLSNIHHDLGRNKPKNPLDDEPFSLGATVPIRRCSYLLSITSPWYFRYFFEASLPATPMRTTSQLNNSIRIARYQKGTFGAWTDFFYPQDARPGTGSCRTHFRRR